MFWDTSRTHNDHVCVCLCVCTCLCVLLSDLHQGEWSAGFIEYDCGTSRRVGGDEFPAGAAADRSGLCSHRATVAAVPAGSVVLRQLQRKEHHVSRCSASHTRLWYCACRLESQPFYFLSAADLAAFDGTGTPRVNGP